MRSKDELLAYADIQELIGIENKLIELKDSCLDLHKMAEIINLIHGFESTHLQRVRDYFTYRDKVDEARGAYRALKAKYDALKQENEELKARLNLKFENI